MLNGSALAGKSKILRHRCEAPDVQHAHEPVSGGR